MADVVAVVPAALALLVGGRGDRDAGLGIGGDLDDGGLGADQHEAEIIAEAGEELEVVAGGADLDLGLQRRADLAGSAHGFDLLLHVGADRADGRPAGQQAFLALLLGQGVEEVQHHAVFRVFAEEQPDFFGGEGEDRRHQPHHRLQDVPQRALGRAARRGAGGGGVEAVLEDV